VTGFKVKTSYLLMPTVFTPNGDGYNDEFRPTYTSIKEYEIWIYNTMGKLMYESNDITVGWDGTHKGHEAPIGAYYYVVKAKGVDGTDYKQKGTVSIVRNADN
jgi:gliding motility-associated-like protein